MKKFILPDQDLLFIRWSD